MQAISSQPIIKAPQQLERPKAKRPNFTLMGLRMLFTVLGPLFPGYFGKLAVRLFSTPRRRAKHKVSEPILEKAKIFEFLYGGHLLKGYEWGEGERIILLVHGWESRGTALRSFVEPLVAKGFRVVAYDAPAHGNSGGRSTNLPNFGGSVRAIIHRLGSVDGIIAHSFGGASTVFSLANLDNSIEVNRLVLIASPSNLPNMLQQFLDMIHAPTGVRNRFYKRVQALMETIPLEDAVVSEAAGRAKVNRLLLIHDKEDQVVPFASSEQIQKGWPNSRLLVTEGFGHFQMVKNAAVVEQVVDFIEEI